MPIYSISPSLLLNVPYIILLMSSPSSYSYFHPLSTPYTAAEAKAETTSRISELEATVTRMKSKRVDKTTTVDDIYEAYPEIKEEVHEEINTHQWHKDIA